MPLGAEFDDDLQSFAQVVSGCVQIASDQFEVGGCLEDVHQLIPVAQCPARIDSFMGKGASLLDAAFSSLELGQPAQRRPQDVNHAALGGELHRSLECSTGVTELLGIEKIETLLGQRPSDAERFSGSVWKSCSARARWR